jgi:hypothetical protein
MVAYTFRFSPGAVSDVLHIVSFQRSENSAITEKKERNKRTGNLPVYSRWRSKRNFRWIAIFVAFIFLGHSVISYIDWSLSLAPTQFPVSHSGTSNQLHFTQRRLAGSPRETAPAEEERGHRSRRRHKKTAHDSVSGKQEAPRHAITNGLLAVNMSLPTSSHPIKQLISDAKVEWEAKEAKQSKTLEQAVAEYKRRNGGMNPPKGFDKWWRFAV